MPSPLAGTGFKGVLSALFVFSILSSGKALSNSHSSKDLMVRAQNSSVHWGSCNNGYDDIQCANVTVPLDYSNASDPRTITLFVSKYPATNTTNRIGSVFLNPGGPGGSGSELTFEAGLNLSTVLQGQYDIVGFDPRGVKMSQPYVSCFDNLLDEEIFARMSRGFRLNLPVNITADVKEDLKSQILAVASQTSTLSAQCYHKVGDVLRYMGTEAVVHDIDFMAQVFDGPDSPIHYWGWSYGTIIGQYMIQMLPPDRIGRIIIDGIVNPATWAYTPLSSVNSTVQIGKVLEGFAHSCASAGDGCVLSNMTSTEIVAKINATLDTLYAAPATVTSVGYPAVADAGILRTVLQGAMYSVDAWPNLGSTLSQAFAGNYTPLIQAVQPAIDSADAAKSDDSAYAGAVIACNDAMQYGPSNPAPTVDQEVDIVIQALQQNSPQVGELGYNAHLCQYWPSLYPSGSRYNGTFGLPDGTLKTPILVFSQENDPVTPLASALAAVARLGNNSRLLEQPGGFGHTTMSQMSFCTLPIVQAYMLNGEVPESNHTLCQVDQMPFVPWDSITAANSTAGSSPSAREAWVALNTALFPL